MTALSFIYPQPRSFVPLEGSSALSARFIVRPSGGEAERLADVVDVERRCTAAAAGWLAEGLISETATVVKLEHKPGLHPQGYALEWSASGLRIAFGAEAGLHYALVTFEQLAKRQGPEWEHFRIEDEPDFPVRGAMLDIGRNKIPKPETLYALVDRLAELKINHLQLYMEGFCFDYEKYAASFPEATPIRAAEFRELDSYAKKRYIDLVPNQNCLGHMGPWLAKPEFRDLAEHPDGIPTPIPLPFALPPTTMNPADERSAALANDLFDELLPNFSSAYVNINLDEPFGLGTGRSRAEAERIGVGELYLAYAERMFEAVRRHGKKPLLWGDVLARHPELLTRLPADVTVLHWNYDAPVPFEPHCRRLRESGVRYYVCPGTSSWNSIGGRTDNMLGNIADAARAGKAYGADGLIVTDWGDGGHWQSPAVSYPGFAYAAGVSWQTEANLHRPEALADHVSSRMLSDRSGIGGSFLLELGRYYHLERSTLDNMTYTHYLLGRGYADRAKLEQDASIMIQVLEWIGGSGTPFRVDYRYAEMELWLQARAEELRRLDLVGLDAEPQKDELANALRLVELGAGLHRYIYMQDLPDKAAEIAWLERLRALLEKTIAEFARLWLARNRAGGLAASMAPFEKLLGQLGERLRALEEG
ncbi:family 20 glycosylhydrolase [Paenibacillus sp.]|uniref:beta-N-acetylhexosaminidase n=1 Tax=Paenibacillus sp. TaxID=58172 RepID=UPI0028119A22|nr:family 20 glycosylhydrolase [Paenibacillus sp.]